MSLHVLEKLAATNPECEVWWDSSPLVYESWADKVLAEAPDGKAEAWRGQLDRLFGAAHVADGTSAVRGVTTNPPLSLQAIQNDPAYWTDRIRQIVADNPRDTVEEVYWKTYLECVRMGAQMVQPMFEKSGGKYGYLSGQVDPRFVTDKARMREQAFQIAALGPNIMVKLPGSKEGYELIEELTANGIATNNTTSFTVPQYIACMNAVSRGLETAKRNGVDLSAWRSVITHMSARLGNIGDLGWQAQTRGIDLTKEEIQLGEIAVIKRAYRHIQETGHPSKMLMCSMRVSRDDATGTASSWHIEKLAGGDFVYTCPPGYIAELMAVEDQLSPFDAKAIDEDISEETLSKLLRIPYFRQAYEFDGMAPEEFSQFGAFVATASEFAQATRKTIDFVARVMAEDMKIAG
ncbi:transaldolase [Rhodospirillaceae bacterium KN72]|uniref:Transaldolase n=1 Tax=Pacificispira spongiicola TaxID=2729598 RepID=A0A7Y0HHP5_9PROT|nr:transaldolase family protein [Pacificispira spongiicola]NMM45699.1 transaldolase [Pacificispira spongiicola]